MNLAQVEEKLILFAELLDEKDSAISKANEMIYELQEEKLALLKEFGDFLKKRTELLELLK